MTGVTAFVFFVSTASLQTLVANGDTRTLTFGHIHTKESLTVTFKRAGRYDPEAVKQINWFLRDWRTDDATGMDPHLFDLLWEVHRETGARGPVTIVSGYRSPRTNSMLRSRGRGVAQYSLHMSGKAIDFFIPGADLAAMRAVGLRLERGGVGYYPSSGSPFIHIDTGGVRHWPRMTRDQLARVFPDGKTVHVPSDGKPMPRYALAKAELDARTRSGATAVASLPGPAAGEPEYTASAATRVAAAPAAPPAPAKAPAETRTTVAAAAPPPMPAQRPSDLRTTTASLPAQVAAAAPAESGKALGYAAEPERVSAHFGPIPTAHARLVHASASAPAQPPASTPTPRPEFHAATATDNLFFVYSISGSGALAAPEAMLARGLVEPARAALRVQFGGKSVAAPATATFSGPAVVALPTVAFDRGAGIIIGRVSSRTN